MNSYTIFQCAQLFERFSAFQRTWFPSYKLQQRLAAKPVNSLVTKKQAPAVACNRHPSRLIRLAGSQRHAIVVPRGGDRRAREIKSVAAKIENDFHLMWRRGIRWILEW